MKFKVNPTILKLRSIIVFLICVMIFGSSWEAVLRTSYLDEVVLVLLIIIFPFTGKKIDEFIFFPLCFYCILVLLSSILYGKWEWIDLLDSLKPLTMFTIIYSLGLTDKERDSIVLILKLVNCISIFVGILNYIMFNIFHSNVVLNTGTYKYINGMYIHRMSGFMSHSGFMAETCAALLIITILKKDIKKINYIEVAFYFLGVYCTKGRVPLAISCSVLLLYVVLKIPRNIRKKLVIFLIIIGLGVGVVMFIPIYKYLMQVFSLDIENQIRFIALRRMGEVFDGSLITMIKKIFFGCGVGYIDTYYESHLAITFLNFGIIGVLTWYFPFLYAELKMFFLDNKYKLASIVLVGYYLINSIINKSYTLPLFEIVCVMFLENNEKILYNPKISAQYGGISEKGKSKFNNSGI